jgi:hypothetical protein
MDMSEMLLMRLIETVQEFRAGELSRDEYAEGGI